MQCAAKSIASVSSANIEAAGLTDNYMPLLLVIFIAQCECICCPIRLPSLALAGVADFAEQICDSATFSSSLREWWERAYTKSAVDAIKQRYVAEILKTHPVKTVLQRLEEAIRIFAEDQGRAGHYPSYLHLRC